MKSKHKLQYSFWLYGNFYYMYSNGFAYMVNGKTEKAKRITSKYFLMQRDIAKNY